MEFLYQDATNGKVLVHSEKRIDPRTGQQIYVLQGIRMGSGEVFREEVFHDWNSYSRRYDFLVSVALPMG
jgi:hypothetical protein